MNPEQQATLDALRVQLEALERHLTERVSAYCPGDHGLTFHNRTPNIWCDVCSRDQRGEIVRR